MLINQRLQETSIDKLIQEKVLVDLYLKTTCYRKGYILSHTDRSLLFKAEKTEFILKEMIDRIMPAYLLTEV